MYTVCSTLGVRNWEIEYCTIFMIIEEDKFLQMDKLDNPTHIQFSRKDIIYPRGNI